MGFRGERGIEIRFQGPLKGFSDALGAGKERMVIFGQGWESPMMTEYGEKTSVLAHRTVIQTLAL